MSDARVSVSKKKIGRPATGIGQMIGVRLQPVLLDEVDAWAADQEDAPGRPEAVRRLVVKGLEKRDR